MKNVLFSWKVQRVFVLCCLLLLSSVGIVFAQDAGSIRGQILEAVTQEPLIGVSILEKGTSNGTVSDIDGNFTIKVKSGSTLIFSYIGYTTMEMKVSKSPMIISMKQSSKTLDEVVVVGFGVQKKVNLTGSVGTATAKDLEARPVANTLLALQGVIPGLNISNSGNGGELNASKKIDIRGTGTIGEGSSSSPLVLIDGMEGNINTINPQDIDNISVLKDAAASSIYGSRAPFGVILITTKRGKEGRPVVNYNNSFRFNTPIMLPKMQNSWEYVNFYDDAMFNKNNTHYYTEEYKQKVKDYYDGKLEPTDVAEPQGDGKWKYDYTWGNVDWLKEYYRDLATSQEHNASISGGNDKMTYYLSANYMTEGGFMRHGTDDFQRYNLTANISAKITDHVKVDYSSRFARTDYSRAAMMYDNFYEQLLRRCRPVRPIKDPNGYYMSDINYVSALEDGGRQKEQKDGLSQQIRVTVTPLKNWNIIGELNMKNDNDWTHWDNIVIYSHYANNPENTYAATMTGPTKDKVFEESYKSTFLNPNIFTNYSMNIGKHGISGTAGYQSEQMKYRNLNAQRAGMININQPVLDLTTDINDMTIVGQYQNWSTAGFFGRLNYDYDGRYLVEGNLRYDGSSRFREDSRWIWTPSFSLGWNIARESFWNGLSDYVQILKLRGSYGILANQNTDNWYPTYQSIEVKASNGSWLVNGAKPNIASAPKLISSSLTWEKIKTTNIGLDFGAFNNRLTGSLDYFIRKTENMVGPGIELPVILGTDVPKTNNTDLKTYGFEFQIGWRDQIGGFKYGARLSIADSQTKILKYPNPTGSLSASYLQDQLIGNIYGYTTIGIAKSDEEMQAHLATLPEGGQNALGDRWAAGDIMYADLNNDGKINNGANTIYDMGDMKKIGNSAPRFLTGVNLDASWGGFDLQMFWQGVLKRDFWPGDDSMVFWGTTGSGEWWSTAFKEHLDYFRLDPNHPLGQNLNSYYPRSIFSNKNHKSQTRYLQNAAYMRLKNLQLGYTFPKALVNKFLIQNLRIFVSGENLLTITSLTKTMDPETAGIGKRGGTVYPLSRTYSFGLNVNF